MKYFKLLLVLISGASIAHVYGPNGSLLSWAFVLIKEWPQYNTTIAIDGMYAIDQMPIDEYTIVAAGNDSYASNVKWINVTEEDTNFLEEIYKYVYTHIMIYANHDVISSK